MWGPVHHPLESSVRVLTPLKAPLVPESPLLHTMCPITPSGKQVHSQCSELVFMLLRRKYILLASSAQNSFTEHVLDIQLTRYVSYVPNGFAQVKVLQARANAIFRRDKVTMLLETVKSTIKPIDQPLELVFQRDTKIETKIAWPFSL